MANYSRGAGGGAVRRDNNGDIDVKTLFQTQTIDQLRVTLGEKRREAEMMQEQLRALVGDRYKDLLSASDMIAGMGDICDCIIDSFAETQKARLGSTSRGDFEPQEAQVPDPRFASRQLLAAVGQIRSWLEDGRYLEASLAAVQLKEKLTQLSALNRKYGKPNNYHSLQALRVRKMLRQLPDDIVRHAGRSLVEGGGAQGPASPIALSSQCIYALSLLHGVPILESLQHFVDYQTRAVRAPLTKECKVSTDTASTTVSTLYSIRAFLYKVFVERSYALSDALSLVGVSTVPASIASSRRILELADCIPASEYLDTSALEKVSVELPSVSDAKAILQRWQSEAAPVAVDTLASALSGVATTAEVVEVKGRLDVLVSGFSKEAIQAQPPSAWGDSIASAISTRLLEILDTELKNFVSETRESVEKYVAEEDRSSSLLDAPLIDESIISQRYRCGSAVEGDQRKCEAVLDPSLSGKARHVITSVHDSFSRVLESLGTVCANSASATAGEERAVALLQGLLQEVASAVAEQAAQYPAPKMGLLVQGLARAVSHASAAFRKTSTWLTTGLLQPFHDTMHAAYLQTFDQWVDDVAGRLHTAVGSALAEEYWGPDRSVFDKIVWASWEHREEDAGDDGAIASNLPGSPTASIFTALQQSSADVSKVVPSLLREAVVRKLHKQVASRIFPLYTALIREGSVCQPALWQLLLDVRLIGVVCGVTEHGSAEYDEVMSLLLDSDSGIDPVYWSTERDVFEQLFAACVDGVSLALACHGVEKLAPSVARCPREALFVDFVTECDRFPTLHLAPLAPQSQPAFAGDFQKPLTSKSAANGGADNANSATMSGLQGLQHLQALGTGLQQQWKGMKYFNWT